MKKKKLEEGLICHLNYGKVKKVAATEKKLIHVIVQENKTRKILVSAYADRRAINYSLKNKIIALWSTSRKRFWIKGKASGNYLKIIETLTDCDQDEVLFLVELTGKGACHTSDENGNYRKSCFYRRVVMREGKLKLELIKE